MASENTGNLKTLLFDLLTNDFQTNSYYVGLSRAEAFTAGTDISSSNEQKRVRHALQSIKTVSNISFVVPNTTWFSGTVYSEYDTLDEEQTNFYVVNSSREVFICVSAPTDPQGNPVESTVEPLASLASSSEKTFRTSDGYFWRYMYKISGLAYSNFRTADYIPVKKITGTPTIPEEIEQLQMQDDATDGEILNLAIDSGGTGITDIPSITLTGNGSSASFTATVDIAAGTIVNVEPDSDNTGSFFHGQGYDYLDASVPSTDAVLRPIYSPTGGLNADPVKSLKSSSIMIQTQFQGNESNTLLTENDFRSIVLFRGLKNAGSDSDFTGNTANAMKYFTLQGGADTFSNDAEIYVTSQQTIRAKVFYHDTFNNYLYYYQDEETGFGIFTVGNQITDGSNNGTIDVITTPSFDPYSGEILSINNISEIGRVSTQTEDIKFVLSLENCS